MVLTKSTQLLAATSVAFALTALVWPYLQDMLSSSTDCPLGYKAGDLAGLNTGLPVGHPPVLQPAALLSSKPIRARLFHNATFWTAASQHATLDDGFVEALLVAPGGDIAAVGGYAEVHAEARRLFGKEVQLIDLKHAFVLPGLIDAHLHLLSGGLSLTRLDLSKVHSREAFEAAVTAAAANLRPGEWLLGGSWSESQWGGHALPDNFLARQGSRPAFLTRSDSHSGLANSKALELAGITATTLEPCVGGIQRDASGQPTGILRECAMQLVMQHIPSTSREDLQAALARATQHALSQGVTTVVDMGRIDLSDKQVSFRDLEEVLWPAADASTLGIRVMAFVSLAHWTQMATKVTMDGRSHIGGRLLWGGVKEFADGSLGSRTALMWEEYADAPGVVGTRMVELAALEAAVAGAHRAGLQVAIHAIGDQAVDEVVGVFQRVLAADGTSQFPEAGKRSMGEAGEAGSQGTAPAPTHRIEHVQHISSVATLQAMHQLGLAAIPNPQHLPGDTLQLLSRVGTARVSPERAYPLHSMLSERVVIAFGSDWPYAVDAIDALGAVHIAMHGPRRSSCAGDQAAVQESSTSTGASQSSLLPAEALKDEQPGSFKRSHVQEPAVDWAEGRTISMVAALWAHTGGAARVAGLNGFVGQLLLGLRGDFVVLGRSPLGLCADEQMPPVLSTFVDGVCMHGECKEQGVV